MLAAPAAQAPTPGPFPRLGGPLAPEFGPSATFAFRFGGPRAMQTGQSGADPRWPTHPRQKCSNPGPHD